MSYKNLTLEETVKHITFFVSRLWQIYAFGEGNTRTTAVFTIKYLRSLGFNADNELFAEKKHEYFPLTTNVFDVSKSVKDEHKLDVLSELLKAHLQTTMAELEKK